MWSSSLCHQTLTYTEISLSLASFIFCISCLGLNGFISLSFLMLKKELYNKIYWFSILMWTCSLIPSRTKDDICPCYMQCTWFTKSCLNDCILSESFAMSLGMTHENYVYFFVWDWSLLVIGFLSPVDYDSFGPLKFLTPSSNFRQREGLES